MANYHSAIIHGMALLLLLALSASLCRAHRSIRTGAVDDDGNVDHAKRFTSCMSMLDEGAPNCWKNVYFTKFLRRNHVQCCDNYLKMDRERSDCWEYLFDDPTSTQSLQLNVLRCKLEHEPPSLPRDRALVDRCKSELNKGAPNCLEEVYFRHQLPKKQEDECCSNFVMMDGFNPSCFAYLFDDPPSTLALQQSLDRCYKRSTVTKLLPHKL